MAPGLSGGAIQAQEPIPVLELLAEPKSELAPLVDRWALDEERLRRLHPIASSPALAQRLERFHAAWLAGLDLLPWETLSRPAQVDALALRTWIGRRLDALREESARGARLEPLLGFLAPLAELCEARVRIEPLDAQRAAEVLDRLAADAAAKERELAGRIEKDPAAIDRFDAARAARRVDECARALGEWHEFYDGYDPAYGWWCRAPRESAGRALESFARFLREKVVRVGSGEDDIVGDPIGAEALSRALEREWIPYTARELVDLAERQFSLCESEMRRASAELGFGDDWKRALEHVKRTFVAPGEQPILVRDLMAESVAFLREKDLISVPSLALETWRMGMLSPDAQRQNPFFLGGDSIWVSYPTDAMSQAEKRMSLRGNNPYFSRAVVHHELIPGHNLQGFLGERHNAHRRVFSTPFWTEGWALYWELLLWERGFAATPEQRVGMLFWRMHRAARIVFSLKFHLGELDAKQCIELLVERVGHERANAAAEVRRSFAGDYGPLYQAGYLLGGLQLQALHREVVDSGRMGERAFHDAVIRAGSLPIELVRALFSSEELAPDMRTHWRFAD